jgi:hypothetical protein
MSDYEPDYVYLIPVSYKKREVFYETITKVPIRLRGAFLMNEDKNDKIEVQIMTPSNKLFYFNVTSQDIFDLNATEAGTYTISFDNRYTNTDIRVTFTMNTGHNTLLRKEDLNITEAKASEILDFMSKYSLLIKMRENAQSSRFISMFNINIIEQIKANQSFYTFSVLETIILISVSFWQFYYMKQIAQTK